VGYWAYEGKDCVKLSRSKAEHERLYLKLANEWVHLVANELPRSYSTLSDVEIERQQTFLRKFTTWLGARATHGIISAGDDNDDFNGLALLMYRYLDPDYKEKVLAGRRLATIESGRLGLVPENIQYGDKIVCLAGSPMSYVLRDHAKNRGQDLALKECFWANLPALSEYDLKYLWGYGFKTSLERSIISLQRSILIGECYVDGNVAWGLRNQRGDDAIYALR
jgi:hypothetical protein